MRAGVPHGRARAREDRPTRSSPTRRSIRSARICGVGCQLTYHVEGQHDRARRGPRRPVQPRAPVREGPLRLRLRRSTRSASPSRSSARPGAAKTRELHGRSDALERRVPRGHVGGGARPRRQRPRRKCATRTDPRRSRDSAAPRAPTRRRISSRSWCAPASAPTTSTTARACATPRRWRHCSKASARARSRTRCPTWRKAEVIFLIGANPTSNHPVAATWMKNAVQRGAKLIVADPRRNDLARHAWRYLQFTADMDVALLNAMIYTIIEEDLVDQEFIRQRTTRLRGAARRTRRTSAPRRWRRCAGFPPETIPRSRARLRHLEGLDDPLGHGHLAARARHRQRALPHRAHAHDRARSAGPARACTRCAGRTTCRARRTRASSR